MNRRGTGVIFILIATLLYCTKYLSAAIFGSGVSSWSSSLFNGMLNYVGDSLSVLSIIALFIGVGYIIWAEKDSMTKK